MCNCNCNPRVQAVVPTSVTVDAASGTTTVTLPATFTPVAGGIYDIPLTAVIPTGTSGTVITITNTATPGNLLNRLGNNVRLGALLPSMVLRVMYLSDPSHYNLISVRRRRFL